MIDDRLAAGPVRPRVALAAHDERGSKRGLAPVKDAGAFYESRKQARQRKFFGEPFSSSLWMDGDHYELLPDSPRRPTGEAAPQALLVLLWYRFSMLTRSCGRLQRAF